MGLLDMFKKKEVVPPFPEPMESPTDVPLESVLIMRQQGMRNPEIIQALSRQNYSMPLIAEAMRQSEAHPGAGIEPMPLPSSPEVKSPMHIAPEPSVSEDVVALVQKNVASVQEQVKSFQSWQSSADEKLADIDRRVVSLQEELKSVHQAVFAQIQEYNKSLKGVGTEIIAMEKVFSESLPELTSSIQKLQRVTKGIEGDSEDKKSVSKKRKFD
ncbi:MAG: hypothetical protein HY363_06415 [Candidatus Aenigmarchaeota archaeon]|nr:hypothetical protein [Candidatus Aenigmarchaeota archaeon]